VALVPELEGNDDAEERYARPDQLVHRAPLVCCVPIRYEWAVRWQQVVQTREGDEVHRQFSEVPVIIVITLVQSSRSFSPLWKRYAPVKLAREPQTRRDAAHDAGDDLQIRSMLFW